MPCKTDRTGGYGAFLANSGPQFVWNALYRRAALAGNLFDENCRYGLEDFIFNATVYAGIESAVYLPKVVYHHYEGAASTSGLQTVAALTGRIAALEHWMLAEYDAVCHRCGASRAAVWAARRAAAVTFLMHQLRDATAPPALRRQAWGTLRAVLRQYPGSVWDCARLAAGHKKAACALLLFYLHLEGLYDLRPRREGKL